MTVYLGRVVCVARACKCGLSNELLGTYHVVTSEMPEATIPHWPPACKEPVSGRWVGVPWKGGAIKLPVAWLELVPTFGEMAEVPSQEWMFQPLTNKLLPKPKEKGA